MIESIISIESTIKARFVSTANPSWGLRCNMSDMTKLMKILRTQIVIVENTPWTLPLDSATLSRLDKDLTEHRDYYRTHQYHQNPEFFRRIDELIYVWNLEFHQPSILK